MGIEDDVARYRAERPLYEELARLLESRVSVACRKAGVRCSVQSRAKTLDSLAKKLIVGRDPYDGIFDKAGVRILLAYPDERDAAADLVRSTFDVTWERDFIASVKPNQFEYRALHFTVGVRDRDREGVPERLWPLVAELQLHRPGEAVWASVSHDLFYKSRLEKDDAARRAMNRLSALLELADESMADIRRRLLLGPGAGVARTIDALERDFLRLRGVAFNEELTLVVVEALAPLLGDVDQFLRSYSDFVAANEAALAHVFTEYAGDFRHVLLSQPESILVFYLLGRDGVGVENAWPTSVPATALEGLQAVWTV